MWVSCLLYFLICVYLCYEYMTEDCVWSNWIKTEPSRCLAFAFAE